MQRRPLGRLLTQGQHDACYHNQSDLLGCGQLCLQVLLLIVPDGGVLDQTLAQLVYSASQLLNFPIALCLFLMLQAKGKEVSSQLFVHTTCTDRPPRFRLLPVQAPRSNDL